MEKFYAEIKKVEDKDASYIEIPFDVEKVYGAKRVKVNATFDGTTYRGSVVRMGTPCYIIGVTKDIRKKINKTFGDEVLVTLEKDEEERIVEVPEDFMGEIEKDKSILEYWSSLSFTAKKKYVTFITSAKKEDTRRRRIDNSISKLRNKEML